MFSFIFADCCCFNLCLVCFQKKSFYYFYFKPRGWGTWVVLRLIGDESYTPYRSRHKKWIFYVGVNLNLPWTCPRYLYMSSHYFHLFHHFFSPPIYFLPSFLPLFFSPSILSSFPPSFSSFLPFYPFIPLFLPSFLLPFFLSFFLYIPLFLLLFLPSLSSFLPSFFIYPFIPFFFPSSPLFFLPSFFIYPFIPFFFPSSPPFFLSFFF